MAGSGGDWHETLVGEAPASGSSNQAFGLVVVGVFAVLGTMRLWQGKSASYGLLTVAVVAFLIARFAAPVFGPFNRAWRWVGFTLSRLLNPAVLTIVFFAVLTPTALVMRLAGKDPLRLRFDKGATTYWLKRDAADGVKVLMTKQY